MTNLELAQYILEGLDQRRDARTEAGNLGEWQTEMNEVARVLHYVIAHIHESSRPARPRCCGADDDEIDDYP